MNVRCSYVVLILLVCFSIVPLGAIDVAKFEGKPAFKEGNSFGYYIWKDGSTWKLRWTTFGGTHRFTGAVHVTGGDIVDMKRIDVETERRVVAPGRPAHVVRGPRGQVVGVKPGRGPVVAERTEDKIYMEGAAAIRFVTITDDDIDGFDFKVRGPAQSLRFVLEIDGASRAVQVDCGRTNDHPADNPFVVPLR